VLLIGINKAANPQFASPQFLGNQEEAKQIKCICADEVIEAFKERIR